MGDRAEKDGDLAPATEDAEEAEPLDSTSGIKKNGSGVLVDIERVKAIVSSVSSLDKAAEKEGSAKLLPGVEVKRGSSFRQVCAALAANLGTVNTGMAFGFSAVAIPHLREETSSITINEDQASWIASLSAMSTPVGCLLSGYLMDALGRKRILLVTQLPMILGWLLIGFATDLPMIYAGRLLVGLGTGMVGAPSRVYTAEATQPHLRGMLSALASLGVSFGVTVEYAMGSVMNWNSLALVSSTVPMVAFILACFLPESPQWLVSRGRREACRCSLKRLRGSTCDLDHELNQLCSFADKNNIHKPTMAETMRALVHPSAVKPFVIITLYFLIYQFSGVNPVTFYAVDIFAESGTTMNKYLATVILGAVRVLFTIVGCLLMRHCGRRPLTFVSSVGCGLTMLTLGTYMYFLDGWQADGVPSKLTWLPVVDIFVFIAVSTIGYLVVPWVMIGEVYPTQVRGLIGGMTTFCGHFFVFIVVKTFPFLQHPLSKHGVFWLYGSISLTGTLFFYFFLPETKGHTLQEIEDYFSGRTETLGKHKKKTANPKNRPIVLAPKKGQALPS